jgi:hypothetical protein
MLRDAKSGAVSFGPGATSIADERKLQIARSAIATTLCRMPRLTGTAKGDRMRTLSIFVMLLAIIASARAEDAAPSRIDSITKSARDMMPAMSALPSVTLPSMPDLSVPDFSDATGRVMSEFNTFTQQVGDALPILEQMGYEVTVFKVTWGLPPKARLRLKSNGNSDLAKVNAIAAKATNNGVLVSALISSAATAKRIQSTMKMGTAFLDVDFAIPPRVNMKFLSVKANEKDEMPRDNDELEVSCK